MLVWSWTIVHNLAYTIMAHAISLWFYDVQSPLAHAQRAGCCASCGGARALAASTGLIASRHLGSVIFGSAIVAVCRLLVAALTALDAYAQKEDAALLLRLTTRCLNCCCNCIRKTIETVNEYALVFVALDGVGFCTATARTFRLLFNNTFKGAVWMMMLVKQALSLALTASIVLPCTCACVYYLEYGAEWYGDEFPSFYPALVVFLVSLFTAGVVADLFRVAVDTILVLAIKDVAECGGRNLKGCLAAAFGVNAPGCSAKSAEASASTSSTRNQRGRPGQLAQSV